MSQYTDEQIRQFIADKGIAGDPFALYNYAQQFGVSPGDVDRVMGLGAGTSDNWIKSQGLKGLDGSAYGGTARSTAPVTNEQIQKFISDNGIANNPQAIQAFATQYGVSPQQVDTALGAQAGQSAAWQQYAGLAPSAGGQPANPYLPGAGPGGMTLAPNPVGGFNSYTPPAATTQQTGTPGAQRPNPYLQNQNNSSTTAMGYGGPTSAGYTGPQNVYQEVPYYMQEPGYGGTQGQRPQGQSQYMQQGGGGRGMGFDNPYTSWMADSIGQKLGQNLQRNLLPGIRSAASQAGGLGGSRQGIAEGVRLATP